MPNRAISLLLCAAIVFATGCHVTSSSQTVSQFAAGSPAPSIITTRYDGEYELYAIPDHPQNELEKAGRPIARVHLDKGRRLGFQIDEHRHPVAIAGVQTLPLDPGAYEWMLLAEPGQYDPDKSVLLAVIIIAAVAIGETLLVLVLTDNGHYHGGF